MTKTYWPSWRYGPNGAAAVFNSPSEVPDGWEDHPSKVVEAKDDETAPLSRADIVSGLKELGIPFAKNAKTETLYQTLRDALEKA